MNMNSFLKSSFSAFWIEEGTLRMYVRKTPIGYYDRWGEIQLATMINSDPGKGDLTGFLDNWEPKFDLYIENVQNRMLYSLLSRRGYNESAYTFGQYPPCMIRRK